MNKEELIGKLQMVYVGDKNALEEMVGYYNGLKQGIEELQQENKKLKAELQLYQGALKREHEAIHRVNELEEVIYRIEKYIEKETRIYGLSMSKGLGIHFDNILGILKGGSNE